MILKTNLKFFSTLILVAIITSCSTIVQTESKELVLVEKKETNLEKNQVKNNTTAKAITGKAIFSKKELNVKAVPSDISYQSIISLITTPDSVNMPNKTISTTLTDYNGNFTLNSDASFNPEINSIFILEAVKRAYGTNTNAMSIRTYVRWNGNEWESITKPSILINSATTAISIIAGHNSSNISSSKVIGSITDDINISPIESFSIEDINRVESLVTQALEENSDPIYTIKLKNNTSTKDFIIDRNIDIGTLILSTQDVNSLGLHLQGVNLSGANLSGKNFSGMDLTGVNLEGANLSNTNFSNCILNNTNFSKTILEGTTLSNSSLNNANLSFIDLTKTNLDAVEMSGVNLAGSTMYGFVFSGNFVDTNFSNSDLSYTDFTEANLNNSLLKGSNLQNSNLSGQNLSNKDLSGCILTGVKLEGTNLQNSNLSNSQINSQNFSGKNLSGINFEGAKMIGVFLDNANLTNVNLREADLSNSYLKGANFSGKDLTGVNFSNSVLLDVNLTGVILNNTNFSKAKWIDGRICSTNSINECN